MVVAFKQQEIVAQVILFKLFVESFNFLFSENFIFEKNIQKGDDAWEPFRMSERMI